VTLVLGYSHTFFFTSSSENLMHGIPGNRTASKVWVVQITEWYITGVCKMLNTLNVTWKMSTQFVGTRGISCNLQDRTQQINLHTLAKQIDLNILKSWVSTCLNTLQAF
jgi:hypothetical protein